VAIAVIRISGPRAGEALKALVGKIPEPRGLRYQVWKIAGGMRLTVKLAGVPENGGNKPA
jgi:tRNA U34 5-carboxymethylaminomethyl modifying GTPase MnmE/TrmE